MASENAPKSLTDRAFDLFHLVIGTGVMAPSDPASLEEIGRDAVRACRAVESEVKEATERKIAAKTRPRPQRPAPPQPDEEVEEVPEWDR